MVTNVSARDDPMYRRWVVATTCGELAGFAIPAIVGATATSVGVAQSTSMVLLVLAGVGEGAVLGWAQSRMLRRNSPGLGPVTGSGRPPQVRLPRGPSGCSRAPCMHISSSCGHRC